MIIENTNINNPEKKSKGEIYNILNYLKIKK